VLSLFVVVFVVVVKVLFKEQKLVERLRSMKHYFLMDQGDL
jgi:hypothetical protein